MRPLHKAFERNGVSADAHIKFFEFHSLFDDNLRGQVIILKTVTWHSMKCDMDRWNVEWRCRFALCIKVNDRHYLYFLRLR